MLKLSDLYNFNFFNLKKGGNRVAILKRVAILPTDYIWYSGPLNGA